MMLELGNPALVKLLKEASKPMDFRTEPPQTPYLIVGPRAYALPAAA